MEGIFKQFVSEKQIEEVKKKRQEEWEKVRRPDQPLGKYKHTTLIHTRLELARASEFLSSMSHRQAYIIHKSLGIL